MRADATGDDMPMMMCGLGSRDAHDAGADAWRRYLTRHARRLRASDSLLRRMSHG